MPVKRCSKCGEVKPLEGFSRSKLGRHGRKASCKICVAAYRQRPEVRARKRELESRPEAKARRWKRQRAYRQRPEVRARKLERTRIYRQMPEVKIRAMINSARKRAKRLGVPFALAFDDITIPDRCPALNIPLTHGDGRPHPGSPTIDRLAPDLGYVPGNIQVISHRANAIKRDATLYELRAIAAYLEEAT